MNYENDFKDMFESIPNYRKTVLLMILIKNDVDISYESGFLEGDIIRLNREFKTFLMEQKAEYLDNIKNEEEIKIEKILKV